MRHLGFQVRHDSCLRVWPFLRLDTGRITHERPCTIGCNDEVSLYPPLIFEVLPEIFQQMPLGTLFGVLFFVLLPRSGSGACRG